MMADLIWKKDMNFDCNNRGLTTTIDVPEDQQGSNLGPTPKELVLNAMMGCTAMDVVVVLKKMRQRIDRFSMKIEAEKNLSHPIHFKTAVLYFDLTGEILTEKAIHAVESSLGKYCGVNYMISKICDISYVLKLNGAVIREGKTSFTDPIN